MEDGLSEDENLALKRRHQVRAAGLNVNKLYTAGNPRRTVEAFLKGEKIGKKEHFNITRAIAAALHGDGEIEAERFTKLYEELSHGNKLQDDWTQMRESRHSTENRVRAYGNANTQFKNLSGFVPDHPAPEFFLEVSDEIKNKLLEDSAVLGRINLAASDFQLEADDIEKLDNLMTTCISIAEKQIQGPFKFGDAKDLWEQQESKQKTRARFMTLTQELNEKNIFIETFFISRPRDYVIGDNKVARIFANSLVIALSNSEILHMTFDTKEVKKMDL